MNEIFSKFKSDKLLLENIIPSSTPCISGTFHKSTEQLMKAINYFIPSW